MAGGPSRPKAAVKARIIVSEFQSVSLLLAAGIIVVIASVWMAVIAGETKAMLEYLKSLGTLLFGAVLALVQAAKAKQKPADPADPQPPPQA